MGDRLHPGQVHQAGGLDLRRAHRLGQEPDHPARLADPARAWATKWLPSATRCPTATWSSRPCSALPPTPTWTSTSAPSKSARNTNRIIDNGVIVYAGVDYEKILRQAEQEVDIVLWDGGNNDFSFYVSDLQIVVADPHRPGHESHLSPRRDQRPRRGCVRDQQGGYRRRRRP